MKDDKTPKTYYEYSFKDINEKLQEQYIELHKQALEQYKAQDLAKKVNDIKATLESNIPQKSPKNKFKAVPQKQKLVGSKPKLGR